jgi:RHS repeat-associated protein
MKNATFLVAVCLLFVLLATATAQLPAPTLQPVPTATVNTFNVVVTAPNDEPGVTLHYTLDGKEPTVSDPIVISGTAVPVDSTATIKVRAFKGAAHPSDVVSANYKARDLVSVGSEHTFVLRRDGSAFAWGSNSAGQFGTPNPKGSKLPLAVADSGSVPFDSTTQQTVGYQNGLPIAWQLKHFGKAGINPAMLAPSGSGLTILQCFQQGLDPIKSVSAAYGLALEIQGSFVSPATVTLVAIPQNPAGVIINKVDFYQGDSLVGTATQTPFQFVLSDLNAGLYPVKAISTDSTGAVAGANSKIQIKSPPTILEPNRYFRGGGTDVRFLSSIIAVDFQKGKPLDRVTDFKTLFPPPKFETYPWFLRATSNLLRPWYHIGSKDDGTLTFGEVNSVPILNGSPSGGSPPMVAFGSAGGGSPLFANQSYRFGIVSGGQVADATAAASPDIQVEVFLKSDFANGAANVTPIYTENYTVPRAITGTIADWALFVSNSFVKDFMISRPYNGKTIDFLTRVQLVPGTKLEDWWGQVRKYPLLVTHRSGNTDFVFKVSYMGRAPVLSDPNSTYPMAAAFPGGQQKQVYNITYSLDFDEPSTSQASYISQPHFQTTPLPSAYQGKSLEELIHQSPPVRDSLPEPTETGLNLTTLDQSPELRKHPTLDQFVGDISNANGNDVAGVAMQMANYVHNEIDLVDPIGVNSSGQVSEQSINPRGVARNALATYLEGQGSPTEQCGLLIYLLRKAGIPCGYIFPERNGLLMFDQQMSKLLRMQIRGTQTIAGPLNVPELVPVNYPWVAAYVDGKWMHFFPWIKDTEIEEGYNLWAYMPQGYNTGGQWAMKYLLNDPSIRRLSSEDSPSMVFPLFVEQKLAGTGISIDQVGNRIRNRRHHYTRWNDFPRPWATPQVSTANLAQDLMDIRNPALKAVLENIFDTLTVTVTSDRNRDGLANSGEPTISTGALRLVDLHDRRFFLSHKVTATSGPDAPKFDLRLSLEAFSSEHAGQFAFANDPGALTDKQLAVLPLQTTAGLENDDLLLFQVTYNWHRQTQGIPNLASLGHWAPFLGLTETTTYTDTRYLRKGDTACLCMDYGRVSSKMQQEQAQKYWNHQQYLQANPTATADPELAVGQLLYVLGQSYFRQMSSFREKVENWTKTRAVSWWAYGLTKLSPMRDASGNPYIVNGEVDLRFPRVDMVFARTVWAGNGATRPDAGEPSSLAWMDAGQLLNVEGSAAEHRLLNQFFQQTAAVSTVRLLDIAQGWTPTTGVAANPGSGIVNLNITTANPNGTLIDPEFTVRKTNGDGTVTRKLSQWAGASLFGYPKKGSIWEAVENTLITGKYPTLSNILLTPGPVTATGQGGQPYTGMGAYIVGVDNFTALISDSMIVENGGHAGRLNYGFFDFTPFSKAAELHLSLEGVGTFSNFKLGTPTSPLFSSNSWSDKDFGITLNAFKTGSLYADPSQRTSIASFLEFTLQPELVSNTGENFANSALAQKNSGNVGTYLSNYSFQSQHTVADPVNVITGEFYADAVDLRLSGPMPLEIRRSYGSLNEAHNGFGSGWKLGYFPFLMLSADGETAPSLIYAAEQDGSVITYRRQESPNSRWIPTPEDNPNLANMTDAGTGSVTNRFNNQIDQAVNGGETIYTLKGADGSVRNFKVQSYPVAGTDGLTRKRPYLQKWQDSRGNYYTFSFGNDSNSPSYGQLVRIQSSNGNHVGFYYDNYGHITEIFSGDGRRLYYDYDQYGDLLAVTLPDGSKHSYKYQHQRATEGTATTLYSTHLLVEERKPAGRVLQNEYDDKRRVKTQRASVGPNSTLIVNGTFDYGDPVSNANGTATGTTSVTDANGNTTVYSYVESQITNINTPPQNNAGPRQNEAQEWYLRADAGQPGYYPRSLKTRTDKRGLKTFYFYDSAGNLKQKKLQGDLTGSGNNAEIAVYDMTYTALNMPKSITDPVGNTTNFEYTDTVRPYLPTAITKGTPAGEISRTTLLYENIVTPSASAYGVLKRETRAAGSADASVTEFTNSSRGFPTSKTRFSNTDDPNFVVSYIHNQRGELTSEIDSAFNITDHFFDDMGRHTGTERYNEFGDLLGFEYRYFNENGEIEWTDGPKYAPEDYTLYRYDGGGRLSEVVKWLSSALPDGSGVQANGYASTLNKHDALGNLTETRFPNGSVEKKDYDAVGEMMNRKILDTAGTTVASESFTYEPGGKVATHASVLGGNESFKYTSRGDLVEAGSSDGSVRRYQYDLSQRLVREVLPNGSYWTTTYDDANRKVSRSFYSADGAVLATESQSFDRRGNMISRTDRCGYTFTKTFDGFDRLKTTSGPPTTPNSAQQTEFHVYDDAGRYHARWNALNEVFVEQFDSVARPVSKRTWNADGTLARQTGFWYLPDQQSVIVTEGSGTTAIRTTAYTDTFGGQVLLIHADGSFQITTYDSMGAKTGFQDETVAATAWTRNALGHISGETLPGKDSARAATNFETDATGSILTRQMPGGQTAKATFDSAGRKATERLDGIGASTRNFTYRYYTDGPNIGKLKEIVDPRGITSTLDYDPFERVRTISAVGALPGQTQVTTYEYDNENRTTAVTQTTLGIAFGSSTKVNRKFDGYGQIVEEEVSIDGVVVNRFAQTWDAAGRRVNLSSNLAPQGAGLGLSRAFAYRADGLMTQTSVGTHKFDFEYGDNGLLTTRRNTGRVQKITQRDSRGRILNQNLSVGNATPLSEVLEWNVRSQRTSYTANRSGSPSVWNETRTYRYNQRGQAYLQSDSPAPGAYADFFFLFDSESGPIPAGAGLGVRTTAQRRLSESNFADFQAGSSAVASVDAFKRPKGENYYATLNSPSGPFSSAFDAAGNQTTRETTDGNVQTITWDATGRVFQIHQVDKATGKNGFDFYSVYDGLGRRLRTIQQPILNGAASGAPFQIDSFFDPEVEFLELGVSVKSGNEMPKRTWKVYGPDLNQRFGGLQGIGGLEAFVDESTGTLVSTGTDSFGNIVGVVKASGFEWNLKLFGSYGLLPGSLPPSLNHAAASLEIATLWQGRRMDSTGLYWMGARLYDTMTGKFISPDPLGHAASANLYDYAGGDPVNRLDPDGRMCGCARNAGDLLWDVTASIATQVWDGLGEAGGFVLRSLEAADARERAVTHQMFGNFEMAARQNRHAAELEAQNAARIEAIGNTYDGYVQLLDGHRGKALLAMASPGFKAYEAYQGIGLEPHNFGDVLTYEQRIDLGANGIIGTTGLLSPLARGGLVRGDLTIDPISGIKTTANVAPRALSQADLGVKGGLQELKGRYEITNGVANVRVDMIRGEISNPFKIIENLSANARAQGASTLRIEGTIANPRLYNVLQNRYGLTTAGPNEIIEVPLK